MSNKFYPGQLVKCVSTHGISVGGWRIDYLPNQDKVSIGCQSFDREDLLRDLTDYSVNGFINSPRTGFVVHKKGLYHLGADEILLEKDVQKVYDAIKEIKNDNR